MVEKHFAPGPDLPFSLWPIAAVQLHQTGHSSIAQHFRRMKVGSADISAIRCRCSIHAAPAKTSGRKGGLR